MPASWRPSKSKEEEYTVVKRDDVVQEVPVHGIDVEDPNPTVNRILQRRLTRRQASESAGYDIDSDDEDSEDSSSDSTMRTATYTSGTATTPLSTGTPTFRITMALDMAQTTSGALKNSNPTETVPPASQQINNDQDGISQTTEHILIAAGSIGATIILVMIVLGLYTMRKRGLTFADVFQKGKAHIRRGPTPPPSKYGMDIKQPYYDDYERTPQVAIHCPQRAVSLTRSASSKTQRPLQALIRGNSLKQGGLARNGSLDKSFYDDASSHTPSGRRKNSAAPSSPILPIQNPPRSASSRNTRSLFGDIEELCYTNTPKQSPLPNAPTFRQFLSNRPHISQRPGLGGAITSRFSWTNSNAPQTPHEVSRDTAVQPVGRDSFMTQRSSVPRFRTVNSWVNQQSTRVEEQRLRQQFRMTQSSTSSRGDIPDDTDIVPEMPTVPQHLSRSASTRSNGGALPGKHIKHERNDTTTTIQTAPIFKAHPGTEIRFSVRSAVPSEVLDIGRQNAAL